MNDRYLFRAWSIKENKYFYDVEDLYDYMQGMPFFYFGELIKDENYVVEQFTGLKDKNGKLVFENDIVNTGYGFFVIQYCDTCKQYQLFDGECFACLGDFHWYEFIDELATVEVIGNIHQNSELLEKGGK